MANGKAKNSEAATAERENGQKPKQSRKSTGSIQVKPDTFKLISLKVEDGVTYKTEAMNVAAFGVIQRDTVIANQGVSVTTLYLPGIRVTEIVDAKTNNKMWQYSGGSVR